MVGWVIGQPFVPPSVRAGADVRADPRPGLRSSSRPNSRPGPRSPLPDAPHADSFGSGPEASAPAPPFPARRPAASIRSSGSAARPPASPVFMPVPRAPAWRAGTRRRRRPLPPGSRRAAANTAASAATPDPAGRSRARPRRGRPGTLRGLRSPPPHRTRRGPSPRPAQRPALVLPGKGRPRFLSAPGPTPRAVSVGRVRPSRSPTGEKRPLVSRSTALPGRLPAPCRRPASQPARRLRPALPDSALVVRHRGRRPSPRGPPRRPRGRPAFPETPLPAPPKDEKTTLNS